MAVALGTGCLMPDEAAQHGDARAPRRRHRTRRRANPSSAHDGQHPFEAADLPDLAGVDDDALEHGSSQSVTRNNALSDAVTDAVDAAAAPGAARRLDVHGELDPSAWSALLEAIAAGEVRLTVTTSSGARTVVISEDELNELQEAVNAARSQPPVLTPRERQVLQRVACGDSLAQVASSLGVSVSTVNQHLIAARRKYGVRSSAEAVARAQRASHLD